MVASITDKFARTFNGSNPEATYVATPRLTGATTLICNNLSGWPTDTKVHFITYKLDTDGKSVKPGSQTDWIGIVASNTITNLTRITGASDTGNAANDIVEMTSTAKWADDLVTGVLTSFNQDGSLKESAVDAALGGGNNIVSRWAESFPNYVVPNTGVIAVSSGLTCTISDIIYYISGIRYSKTGIPNKTFTASKDTYCFIDTAGNITYTEVANGADAPSLPANSIFTGYVETSASAVTAIHLRNRGTEKVGLVKKLDTYVATQGATGDTAWNGMGAFKVYLVAGYRYKISFSVSNVGSDRNDQQTLYMYIKQDNNAGGLVARGNLYLPGSSAFREGQLTGYGFYDATVSGSKTFFPSFGSNPGSGFTIFFNVPGTISVECVGLTSESA